MPEPERWAFHTDIYAFRALYLGIDDLFSPCDPEGQWYDDGLVRAAIGRLRDKRAKEERDQIERRAADPFVRENDRRYAAGLAWQREHAAELREGVKGFKRVSAAAALGVTATER